jgi:hypothetical protein
MSQVPSSQTIKNFQELLFLGLALMANVDFELTKSPKGACGASLSSLKI